MSEVLKRSELFLDVKSSIFIEEKGALRSFFLGNGCFFSRGMLLSVVLMRIMYESIERKNGGMKI